jgi:hypothetical protein
MRPSHKSVTGVDPIDPHRPCNVVQLLLAEIIEYDLELADSIFLHAGGDADPGGFSQAF